MSIRKFLHINTIMLIASLMSHACHAGALANRDQKPHEPSRWERFIHHPIISYAPSLISAGVGLYQLNNVLSRGISRDTVYALGLAASPILANYVLYRDEQQGNQDPLVCPKTASKLRFAAPTLSLMALLALHGGYRNFWLTAPYQAALTTAGLVGPGVINAWWKAQDEQEGDIQRLKTWREERANVELEKLAEDLLLSPDILNADVRSIDSAVAITDEASEAKKQKLADHLTIGQLNGWMYTIAKEPACKKLNLFSKNILRRLLKKEKPSDSLWIKLDNIQDANDISEADFRNILTGLLKLIQDLNQLKRIMEFRPQAIKNILKIVNDRELMRQSNPSLDVEQLYGDISGEDVFLIEDQLKKNQKEIEQKKLNELLKQLKTSSIIIKAFNEGYRVIPSDAWNSPERKGRLILNQVKSTLEQIEQEMQSAQKNITWQDILTALSGQRSTLTDNDTLPNRIVWFNSLATEISKKIQEQNAY